MADEGVQIRIRTRGGRESARDIRGVAEQLARLGPAGRIGAAGLTTATAAGRTVGRGMGYAADRSKYLAAGLVGVSAIAGRVGVAFNVMQDSQRVGFTAMLHSGEAAADMMRDIQALALRSPILNPQQTGEAARALMSYGVPVKEVLGDVERLGDMAAASGKSIAEVMPLGARALGQIASRGRLSAEELNQLSDSVGLSQKAIRKELGMTQAEFMSTFTAGNAIPAERALPAIRRAMENQSKGAAKMLAETTAGQFDAARERFAKRMGQLTRPVFDEAGDIVGNLSKELDTIAGRDDLTLNDKLTLGREAIRRNLEPVGEELGAFWRRNHIGERLSDEFEIAAPKIMDAAGHAAGMAAGAFVRAWWNAGPWGKLFAAAIIAKKARDWGLFAGGRFLLGWRTGTAAGLPLPTTAGTPVPGGRAGKLGKLGRLGRLGRALPVIGAGIAAADVGYNVLGPALFPEKVRHEDPHMRAQTDEWARRKGWVPGKGWTHGRPRTSPPPARAARREIHTHVHVDRREVARAVHRFDDDETARNRRGNP